MKHISSTIPFNSPKTRPYITLRDRTWKGKEWWASYGSDKFIRKLTDEEAATLDDIELVPEPKPFEKIVGSDNGRMFCLKCDSRKGFYPYKMHRGAQKNWYTIYKCADCGSREKEYETTR